MSNIALVVLDTLRKDAFDEHFDWVPGRWYDRAYSTSHRTVPAHASLFTGRYAGEIGIGQSIEHLDYHGQVLAEKLAEKGYTTRAYSANPYISGQFDYDRGFQQFEGSWRLQAFDPAVFDWGVFISNTEGEGPSRFLHALWRCVASDSDTIRSLRHGLRLKLYSSGLGPWMVDDGAKEAVETIRETAFGSNEFLFINLMEAHAPYNPPSAYRTTEYTEFDGVRATVAGDSDIDADRVRRSYDDSVRYLSDTYRTLFGELREEFDYIITLSDHGEAFREHDAWNHCYGVFPELTHVPLVLTGDGDGTIHDDTVASILDVHRTVLELGDVPGESRGRDLLSQPQDGVFLTECQGLTPRQYERLQAENIESQRLEAFGNPVYGLAAPNDYYGYETHEEFVESGSAMMSDPRKRLDTLKSEISQTRATKQERALSESVLNQLDQLGYT